MKRDQKKIWDCIRKFQHAKSSLPSKTLAEITLQLVKASNNWKLASCWKFLQKSNGIPVIHREAKYAREKFKSQCAFTTRAEAAKLWLFSSKMCSFLSTSHKVTQTCVPKRQSSLSLVKMTQTGVDILIMKDHLLIISVRFNVAAVICKRRRVWQWFPLLAFFLYEVGYQQMQPTVIGEENHSFLKSATNPVMRKR